MSDPKTTVDVIADALVAAGLAQDVDASKDWQIRVGYLQAAPNRSICVYPAGGRPPESGPAVDYPNIQVRVRGEANDYDAVQKKELAIYLFLHAGNAPIQFGSDWVYCYAMQSEAIPLGQDENRRPSLVRNYRIMKERPTS